MLACPNINLQEWKNLVLKLGIKNAFREYMSKGDGTIPNADNYDVEVDFNDPEFADFITKNPEYLIPSEEEQKQKIGQAAIYSIADKISENLNVAYNVVTPEQAREITEAASNPWNGEKSFFYNGQVYLVGEGFNTEMVLHEFSHPLIDAVFIKNNELFKKLHAELLSTAEGQAINEEVAALYPNLKETDPDYLKEVVVRGLTKESLAKLNNQTTSTGFKNFIDKLLFALKQTLRKIFGVSVKVEKLSVNTTLNELAKMLTTDKFKIDTELITRKDFVEYLNNISNLTEAFQNIEEDPIIDTINQFYDTLTKQAYKIKKDKDVNAAKKLLLDDASLSGFIPGILSSLTATPEIDRQLEKYISDLEARKRNISNLVHAFRRFDLMSKEIYEHMSEILKIGNSQDTLSSVYYYDSLVREWDQLLEDVSTRLIDSGMDPSSDFGKLLSSTKVRVESIKRQIQSALTPSVVDTLMTSLKPLKENIDADYSARIDKIKNSPDANTPKMVKLAKDLQTQWDNVKITEEKVLDTLLGKLGDTNPLSAHLEAFTNSPDTIVGGFAVFIKSAFSDVDIAAQRNNNKFKKEVLPFVQEAGYDQANFVDFTEKVSFKDKVMVYDYETNKYVEKEYWTFLSPFKNTNLQLKSLQEKINAAKEISDQDEVNRLVKEQRQHLRDYFHQEYVDEFYQREDVYDSLDKNLDLEDATYKALGIDKTTATAEEKAKASEFYDKTAKEVYKRRYLILNEIQSLDALDYEPEHFEEVNEQKKMLWREYSQITALKNLSGDDKQGDEYLMALIEKKYRKQTNKFYEWVPIKDKFEIALNQFEQNLIDSGVAADSDEFKEKREKWINDNTVIKYTKKFYDERNDVLDRLKEVFKLLPDSIRFKVDSTDEMGDVLDIFTGFRDQDGQVIGSDISDKSRDKIKNLQQKILEKKDSFAGYSGLNKDQLEELGNLFDKIKSRQKLTPEETIKMDDLLKLKNDFSVDKATQVKIQALYRELGMIQSKEATDYYVDIINNWFGKIGEPKLIDNNTAADLLTPEKYEPLFEKSDEFKEWFLNNHIAKQIYDKSKGKYITVYERLFLWNRVRPNDPDHYEQIKLSSGETIYRTPNTSYFKRRVKDEFMTKKVVGQNVDNKGNFLPKTLAQGAKSDTPYLNPEYDKLKASDPKAFAALEKIKEYYLDVQDSFEEKSRLYLQIPRFETKAVEMLRAKEQKINPAKRLWLNIRKQFVSAKDDFVKGFNFDPMNLAQADILNTSNKNIPIDGLYDLAIDETSLNSLDSINRYMVSGLKQKKLNELNPVTKTLQSILQDPANTVTASKKYIKAIYKNSGRRIPGKEKYQKVRAQAINNFVDREFYGVRIKDFSADDRFRFLWKTKSFFSKIASRASFAWNFPNAIKNRNAAVVQGFIEASSGRFLNLQSWAKGKGRAWIMLGSNSAQIYTLTNKSLDVQLMEIFDPGQDYFHKQIGQQFGRSFKSDLADLSFLMSPRKFLQLQATMEVMCGMLYHQKLKQTINDKTNEISYMNAFEIRNGQIELKPGIDKAYAPGGEKFNEIKNRIHEIGNRLEGTYAGISQPEINRTFFGQLLLFFRKFFTSMFMNQVAFNRPSAALGAMSSGNISAFLRTIINFGKYGFNYRKHMSDNEIHGVKNVAAQVVSKVLFGLANNMFFGFDDDDMKKSMAKIRKRSGDALSDKFKFWGWLHNQALAVTLETEYEYGTFTNPITLSQTIGSLTEIGPIYDMGLKKNLLILKYFAGNILGNESSYYKKDVQGSPYPWQKKGRSKAWNQIAQIFGITGKTVSPELQIQATQSKKSGAFR